MPQFRMLDGISLTCLQGCNRKIFLRGQSHFPDFFPDVKCFFLVENFHFGTPKTNLKKRGVLSSFWKFSLYPFSIFHLPFYNFPSFLLHFPPFQFFPCLFFPGRSAEISRSEVSGGTAPHLLRHCMFEIHGIGPNFVRNHISQ